MTDSGGTSRLSAAGVVLVAAGILLLALGGSGLVAPQQGLRLRLLAAVADDSWVAPFVEPLPDPSDPNYEDERRVPTFQVFSLVANGQGG